MESDEIADRVRAAEPGQAVRVAGDLALFRVAKARFRSGQSYALLRDDATVLVDAVHAATRAAVDAVLADAAPPAALLLTHSDLLGQAFGPVDALADWLGAPVLIHHADRQGTSARPLTFSDGADDGADGLLAALGVAAYPVPGHTPGSTVFVARPEGYVFTGDAAVGPTYDAERGGPGVGAWSHAPITDADWVGFADGWRAVAGPAAGAPPAPWPPRPRRRRPRRGASGPAPRRRRRPVRVRRARPRQHDAPVTAPPPSRGRGGRTTAPAHRPLTRPAP